MFTNRHNPLLLATTVYAELSFLSRWPVSPEQDRWASEAMIRLGILLSVLGLAACATSSRAVASWALSPPLGPVLSSFVFVDGEVRTPFRCTWTNGLTLSEAVQMAGGFTDLAKVSAVTIRHDNGVVEKVKCSRRFSGTWPSIHLASGDVVHVPKKAGFPLPPNKPRAANNRHDWFVAVWNSLADAVPLGEVT